VNRSAPIVRTVLCLVFAAAPAFAGDKILETLLPTPACAEGWTLQEKVTLYDKETLFDRIDGEAELFFPYGFKRLDFARYSNRQDGRIVIEADVYEMGSLLDAFGIYATYRRKDGADIAIGAEGTISPAQLFFYQGRYFVRLQGVGVKDPGEGTFLSCARAISGKLPRVAGGPTELEAFTFPAVEPKSERYIAKSLFGYDFFRRGFVADATLKDGQVQLFLVPEHSTETARKAFDRYRSYLETSGKNVQVTEPAERVSLSAIDPLYGNVFVEQNGRFLVGAIRIKDIPSAKQLVGQLRQRIPAQ
jgi:hypothetical protein